MPWGKLDDSLYDHPKLDALGSDRLPCIGLWAVAISWSNRRLTDGYLTAERITMLGGTLPLADELVRAGLFEKVDGDYQVHDFLEFNASRESVLKKRADEAARQRSWRESQRSHGVTNGVTNGVSTSTPTRPVPVPNPNQGDRIFERMMERRREYLRETGKWPEDWGPRPEA